MLHIGAHSFQFISMFEMFISKMLSNLNGEGDTQRSNKQNMLV